MSEQIAIFQGKSIRKTIHKDEWWFSIVDVIETLTDSADPKQYIKKMKQRDPELFSKWGTICTPLELLAPDGKKRKTNCANTKGIFRIIQSIPSPKAEPFKQWLAKVGYERIQEIENPELAIRRMREIFIQKGYSDEWIEKRIRGMEIRKTLTTEWDKRGINRQEDYAILTAEISKAAFGMTPEQYKKHKGLDKKTENLRDHMTDLELIFTMLGDASTTEIARNRNTQGFNENKKASQEGGTVAGKAREELEKRSGRMVISKTNYKEISEQEQRKLIE